MRNNLEKKQWLLELFLKSTLSDFTLMMTVGLLLLVIAAHLAEVRFGSLPANPLYWHYSVIVRAKNSPISGDQRSGAQTSRPYFYFWAMSLCSFFSSALILASLFYKTFIAP